MNIGNRARLLASAVAVGITLVATGAAKAENGQINASSINRLHIKSMSDGTTALFNPQTVGSFGVSGGTFAGWNRVGIGSMEQGAAFQSNAVTTLGPAAGLTSGGYYNASTVDRTRIGSMTTGATALINPSTSAAFSEAGGTLATKTITHVGPMSAGAQLQVSPSTTFGPAFGD